MWHCVVLEKFTGAILDQQISFNLDGFTTRNKIQILQQHKGNCSNDQLGGL